MYLYHVGGKMIIKLRMLETNACTDTFRAHTVKQIDTLR
jgi:hypothetical protein